jgi:hypothetical protein
MLAKSPCPSNPFSQTGLFKWKMSRFDLLRNKEEAFYAFKIAISMLVLGRG